MNIVWEMGWLTVFTQGTLISPQETQGHRDPRQAGLSGKQGSQASRDPRQAGIPGTQGTQLQDVVGPVMSTATCMFMNFFLFKENERALDPEEKPHQFTENNSSKPLIFLRMKVGLQHNWLMKLMSSTYQTKL